MLIPIRSSSQHILSPKDRGDNRNNSCNDINFGWCPRGVKVKALDCGIVVSEFVFQSGYYVHFQANTLGKGMNPLILPCYGLNSTTTVLLGEWLWH